MCLSAPLDWTFQEVRDFVLSTTIFRQRRRDKIWGQEGGDTDGR